VIAVRLKNAREEMAQKDFYRHIITNDRLTDAVTELIAIFEKYRS
jgi:guanylate kinase